MFSRQPYGRPVTIFSTANITARTPASQPLAYPITNGIPMQAWWANPANVQVQLCLHAQSGCTFQSLLTATQRSFTWW